MLKKTLLTTSALAVAAILPVSAIAQSTDSIFAPRPYPMPQPPTRLINVTPGNPVSLNSCGYLEVKGRGWARVENFNGSVSTSVHGKVAIKSEDLNSVKLQGFNHKFRRGDYIVYSGRGTAVGNSGDLDLIVLGKGKVTSKGCGETHLKGRWQGSYQHFWRVVPIDPPYPYPQPLPLPVELQELEAQALAE